MQTVRIYRLGGLARPTRQRLQVAQMEAAQVWNHCRDLHLAARQQHQPWPDRDGLQRATKGGQFALHSQSIQMVCHQFLANVETTRQVKPIHPRMRYPYKTKKYRTVSWPAQAIARQGKRLILPMGRGRKALSFRLDLPERIEAVSLVWHGGYELHQEPGATATQAGAVQHRVAALSPPARRQSPAAGTHPAAGARPAAQGDPTGRALLESISSLSMKLCDGMVSAVHECVKAVSVTTRISLRKNMNF
jgi:hypothetical protein